MKIAKVRQLLWPVLFFMTIAFPGIAAADGRTDAVKLVKEAIAYYKTYGIERTIEALNNPNGPFVRGDLYVFAYSFDGTMLANVSKPNLVGQKVIDTPDTNGKKFRREIIEKAKRDGFGWADYVTSHPKTRLNQQKTSYFESVDDEIVLSCGIYKEEATGVKSDAVTRSR